MWVSRRGLPCVFHFVQFSPVPKSSWALRLLAPSLPLRAPEKHRNSQTSTGDLLWQIWRLLTASNWFWKRPQKLLRCTCSSNFPRTSWRKIDMSNKSGRQLELHIMSLSSVLWIPLDDCSTLCPKVWIIGDWAFSRLAVRTSNSCSNS